MLTTIHITVRDRVPTITAGEDVISHNSDYVAEFEFDEEWQDKVKTVYFVCEDGSYEAVVMSGNSCGVPMLDGEHRRIFVGVQAGAAEKPSILKTTRPCCLKVKDSIADYLGQPIPDPTPDVYEQIIAMLNNLTAPTWDSVQNKPFSTLGRGLAVDENGVLSADGGGSANAVQYVAQTLTDEQKAQARSNIDADKKRIVVEARRSSDGSTMVYYNVDDQNAAIDKFIAEYKAGTEILLRLYNRDYPLTNIDEDGIVYFSGYIYDAANKSVGVVTYKMEKNKAVVEESSLYGIKAISLDNQLKYKGYAADAKAVGDALGTKLDKNQGAGNAGKILGIGADGNVVPQDKPTYTLPQATADALGGIKADVATAEDTQVVRIGTDGKLRTKPTGGSSITVDDALSPTSGNPVRNKVVTAALAEKITAPTTAAVGQIIKVKSVDSTGKPTEWECADLPRGGIVTDEQVNTAVSAWLTEHPEATTTVADGSITPDKLSNAEYLWQIFNPTEYLAGVTNATINTNTGAVNPYNDTRYRVSPFIAADFDTYAVRIPYAEVGLNKNYDRIGTPCCYDADYAFLGVATTPEWNDDGKAWNATFTTVEGTKYIRFSANGVNIASAWTEGYIESIVICKGGVIYPYYFVGKIAIWDKISIADSARDNTIDGKKLLDNSIEGVKFKDLSVTKDKIAEVSPEVIYGCDFKNLFDKELYDLAGRVTTHYIRGGWLNSSGALSDAVNALGSWVTLFIPCYPNTTYALYAFNDAGETTTSYFRNYISYRDKTSEKVIEAVAVGEPVITTPVDTYYICVTLTVNDQASQQKIINRMMLVKANEVLTSYYPYMVRPHRLKTDNFADGTQIICYGDSLTQNKYPAKLESLLGVPVTDAGVGGNTIAQIYNRVGNYGTNYSIVTLMVGTNDNGGQTSCPLGTIDDESATDDNATDTSTTYVSRLKRLINKIKTTHPGATYVIMPPFEHTWSNFSGLVDVMRQVAELYSIPFLDIFHLCGFRGTDTADAALYLSDGTHENDLGAQRIAELLAGFIKQLKGA